MVKSFFLISNLNLPSFSLFHTIALTFGSIFSVGLGCNDFSNAYVPCHDQSFWSFSRLTDKHNSSRLRCFALLLTGLKLAAKPKNLPLITSLQRQQKKIIQYNHQCAGLLLNK